MQRCLVCRAHEKLKLKEVSLIIFVKCGKNKTKVKGSTEFSSLHTVTKGLCLTFTWLILLWAAKVWTEALTLLECWAQPFAARSVNVCLPSLRLLEQLNHGRQNRSRGSKVLIFHVFLFVFVQKEGWLSTPRIIYVSLIPISFIFCLSRLRRWTVGGHPAHLFGISSKPAFYVLFLFFCLSAALE